MDKNMCLVRSFFSDSEITIAKIEGWKFEEHSGEIVLSRLKRHSKIYSIDDVYEHVIKKSKEGSEFHCKVMDFLKSKSPIEYNYQNARFMMNQEEKI